MNGKKWIAGIGICAMLAGATLANAQGMQRRNRPGRPGMKQGAGQGLAKQLQLTEEQKKLFKESRQAMQEAMKGHREKVQAMRKELRELWKAEKPDRAKILAKHDEMAALQRKMVELRLDHRLKMHAQLSPEQRKKAVEIMEKAESRQGEFRQRIRERMQNMRQKRKGPRGRKSGRFGGRRWDGGQADDGADDGDDDGDDDDDGGAY